MTKRPLAALVAASIVASVVGAQTPTDSVRRLDSAWVRAYTAHDSVAMEKLLARDIAVTTSTGTVRTRAEEIADYRQTPGLTIHAVRTNSVDINVAGANAVVIGDIAFDLSTNGQRRILTRRYTATYSRGGALGWQMTALHFFPASVSSAAIVAPANAGVDGRWEGAIGAGPNRLRIVLEITRSADGLLSGVLRSLDQGGGPIPVERVTQKTDSVRVDIPVIGGRYEAALSLDRTQLNGVFTQGGPRPLVMTRTAAASSGSATPTPAPVSPFGLMVDVDVPVRPTAVTGGGKRHLIYELHLTNFAGGELLLTKIEALSRNGVLASYEGAALNAILLQPRLGTPDNRSLTAAGRAIAFIQITLDSGVAMPNSVRHRITAGMQSLETAEMPIAANAVAIGAPFRGSDWRAANGPSNTSGHRRALIPIGGKPAIAQRFAIDWVQVNPTGATFTGNQLDNKSYRAYGAEILAVADGIVSAVKDGIPENIPGMNSRAVPINLETIGGNHIVQDIGSGRYAFYAHLQPGSLRVKAGERVKKGQVIGLLGNSGNSTEPHLHFHVMDGTSPLGSEGLPYVIEAWELQTSPGTWERRTNQLPMMNMMVRFPPPPAAR